MPHVARACVAYGIRRGWLSYPASAGPARPLKVTRDQWAAADWSLSDYTLASSLGVSKTLVNRERRKRGIPGVRR